MSFAISIIIFMLLFALALALAVCFLSFIVVDIIFEGEISKFLREKFKKWVEK